MIIISSFYKKKHSIAVKYACLRVGHDDQHTTYNGGIFTRTHIIKVKHITASSVLMQCISSVAYLWQAKHDKSGLSLKSAPIEFQSSICEIRKSLYENWKSLYEN